jgi:L,D-transpeptidase YcbB
MIKLSKWLLCMLIASSLFFGCGPSASQRAISEKLKANIEVLKKQQTEIEGDLILNAETIADLYDSENELLLEKWGNKNKVDQMLTIIRNISNEGLRPEDYHLKAIEKLVDRVFVSQQGDVEDKAKLELLLTDAFLLMSTHLAIGKTDSETIDPQWNVSKRVVKFGLEAFIDSALVNDHIIESLQSLSPPHREYDNLRKALVKYREIEANGGWESFSTNLSKLAKNTRHPDVAVLRNRLKITQGDVYGEFEDENLFDQGLHEQVVLFQRRNGLTADGVVAKTTIEALNVSVEDRIAAIEANLERWRWVSDNLGKRYIKVNIANFELQVVEDDQPVFISEAIVGRPYRKTPVFSARMTYLVLAPTWTVPPTILRQDVIPAVIKDPSYLKKKNMQVLQSNGTVVDPATIDWKRAATSGFPYMIRQDPGKDNALGAVKFMFPNQYSVYIHDTPTRNLFTHADRSFSSGCIRISKPLELAAFLLSDKPEWTMAQIQKIIDQGKEHTVRIKPVPVHLLYLTTWAESDGTVHFRKDIYDRDQPLLNALKQAPPSYVAYSGEVEDVNI